MRLILKKQSQYAKIKYMIAYLQGQVLQTGEDYVIVLCGGVGYEVNVTAACAQRLAQGQQVQFFIEESLSPYDGTSLYGFERKEDKALWLLLKSAVPNTGPKKALELLGKALRAPADFRQAIAQGDPKMLTAIFGFTAKTANKLIASLKDKLSVFAGQAPQTAAPLPESGLLGEVAGALGALGFSAAEARRALEKLRERGFSSENTEAWIKEALRVLK